MLRNIQAVAFDAYETLCYISEPAHPLTVLVRRSGADIASLERACMVEPLDLTALQEKTVRLSAADLTEIEEKIQREVASVRLYPDVLETLDHLKALGFRLGLISNLASPYAAPVQELLGDRIDMYIWSFEVGAIKPEPAIFDALCQRLNTPPDQVLMVGNSKRADVEGAQQFGMPALHLTRSAPQQFPGTIVGLAGVVAWLDTHGA